MQRINGAYLYDFGKTMHALAELEEKECTRLDVYFVLSSASEAVAGIVYQSVFSEGWKVVHNSAKSLLDEIAKHLLDLQDYSTFELVVSQYHVALIKANFRDFEAIIKAELQSVDLYYVSSVGGFDNRKLIDSGYALFPESLRLKVPESLNDVTTGARCMAFELWTSMAFHFHRANEAVLRRYFDEVRGAVKPPRHRTMGTILKAMEQHELGNANIRAALKNITVFHRNPIAHPDHHISAKDEGLSLYAAIRAAMGYMLDQLPEAKAADRAEADKDAIPPLIEQMP